MVRNSSSHLPSVECDGMECLIMKTMAANKTQLQIPSKHHPSKTSSPLQHEKPTADSILTANSVANSVPQQIDDLNPYYSLDQYFNTYARVKRDAIDEFDIVNTSFVDNSTSVDQKYLKVTMTLNYELLIVWKSIYPLFYLANFFPVVRIRINNLNN